MTDEPITCLDLFCGCGGFSLGLHRAGLQILAAIDFDPKAIEVYQANFPKTPHILCEDLTQFAPAELAALLGTSRVDVIAGGGPPCQGFSQVRQRDGANDGNPPPSDARLIADGIRESYSQATRGTPPTPIDARLSGENRNGSNDGSESETQHSGRIGGLGD